jgi:hypothetical protein
MKFFATTPTTVDGVLASINTAISQLEVVEKTKSDEALAHDETISAAQVARDIAAAESVRAAKVRAKLSALIGP